MASPPRLLERLALRPLAAVDAACNRLYGWRGNPLYHTGAITVALLLVLIVTGLWLLLFYRVGAPYASVARLTADPWVGRWVRGVHRYASDATVIAVAVHAVRMFAQGRSWGARALAWSSGVVMSGLILVCGLTGYVMVWDAFGRQLAVEGARLLDVLPVLSEPLGRAFTGEEALLAPFFFINLFAHIAIPLGLALVLWLHVSRVARPVLVPGRRATGVLVTGLLAVAIVWPMRMQPPADAFSLPQAVEGDLFFGAWLLVARSLPAGMALGLLTVLTLLALLLPLGTRRLRDAPPPSVVDADRCTGCRQCSLDCPYEAITMVPRAPGGRSLEVARVDPALCVSCGICAGSCAPMVVGPPGRTGRDQLAEVRALVARTELHARPVVVCCERGARTLGPALVGEGAVIHPVDCAGSLHSSVVEQLVRSGAAGVLVLSCPPRDCVNREGPQWLVERLYHEREAELKARVDRRRLRVAHLGAGEVGAAREALRRLMADVPPGSAGTAAAPLTAEPCVTIGSATGEDAR